MTRNDDRDEKFERANPPGYYHCPLCGELLSGPPRFYSCPDRQELADVPEPEAKAA